MPGAGLARANASSVTGANWQVRFATNGAVGFARAFSDSTGSFLIKGKAFARINYHHPQDQGGTGVRSGISFPPLQGMFLKEQYRPLVCGRIAENTLTSEFEWLQLVI